jgi:2-methylisocitrate lyase-like PEP mutase family enzyme
MGYGDALRDEVHSDSITPLIGIFDMYSASLAAQHYGGMFVSGSGFAASYYGLPDIGFIAWPDMVSFVQRLRLAFPNSTYSSISTMAMSTRRWPATWWSIWSA